MVTARKPRVSTRIRRTSGLQGPRAPMHLVERMQVAVIGLVNAYIDRLMREIDPALRQRFDRVDPLPIGDVSGQVSLGEQFLKTTFHAVDRQAADDLSRAVPIPSSSVLKNSAVLEKAWVKNNTELIQLESRARAEVQRVVTGPLKEGVRVEQVRDLIQARLGVVRSRAELIARDQTLKLYGQIQEARQTEAGITEYTWSTSEDERVRPDHQALDGTTQRWDDPPIVDQRTGRREHPGRDFQCRCAGIPVLPLDGLTEEDNPQEPEPISPTPPEEEQELGPEPEAEADPLSVELERQAAEAAAEEARVAAEQRRLELQAEAEAEAARRQEEARRAEAERIRAEEERRAAAARARAEAEAAAEAARVAETRRLMEERRARAEAARALAEQQNRQREATQAAKGPYAPKNIKIVGNVVDPQKMVEHYTRRISELAPTASTPKLTSLDLHAAASFEVDIGGGVLVEAGAYYETDRKTLVMPTLAQMPVVGQMFDGIWGVVNAAKTNEAAVERIFTHEYGHHLHMTAAEAGAKDFDGVVAAVYEQLAPRAAASLKSNPNRQVGDAHPAEGAVSVYGTQNHAEFWAESFAAYHHEPDWLRANKPQVFEMVESLLQYLRDVAR